MQVVTTGLTGKQQSDAAVKRLKHSSWKKHGGGQTPLYLSEMSLVIQELRMGQSGCDMNL